MDNLKQTAFIYLTAGEVPTANNVISSQALKLSRHLHEMNVFRTVHYIGLVPRRSLLKAKAINKPLDFTFIDHYDIPYTILESNFILGGFFEYCLKDIFAKSDARKIIRQIPCGTSTTVLFHCRSYYAAYVALTVKSMLPTSNIKILFDMRSLLPPEFFFTMGSKGKYLYGHALEWESYLLANSDISLMTTRGGIDFLRYGNPKASIEYIPITGLDIEEKRQWLSTFEKRWLEKKISYIGSVSFWHPLPMIEMLLNELRHAVVDSKVEIVANNPSIATDIPKCSINHREISHYYDSLLGLVVPGKIPAGYFESLQLNINLFSTKAAEALSAGVPLIVNAEIRELSDYIMQNKCGIVFKMTSKGVEYVNCTKLDLTDKKFWLELTDNAFRQAKNFQFKSVVDQYLRHYTKIITDKRFIENGL